MIIYNSFSMQNREDGGQDAVRSNHVHKAKGEAKAVYQMGLKSVPWVAPGVYSVFREYATSKPAPLGIRNLFL
jgi:hypothetical protein